VTSRELVPRVETIVGTQHDLEMVLRVAAHRGRLLTEVEKIPVREIGPGLYAIKARMLMPDVKVPLRTRLRKWDRSHPIMSAMLKAMAFAVASCALIVGAILAAIAMVRHAMAGVDTRPIVGGFVFAVIVLLILANRLNHSGACPGVAVHCPGCKH